MFCLGVMGIQIDLRWFKTKMHVEIIICICLKILEIVFKSDNIVLELFIFEKKFVLLEKNQNVSKTVLNGLACIALLSLL